MAKKLKCSDVFDVPTATVRRALQDAPAANYVFQEGTQIEPTTAPIISVYPHSDSITSSIPIGSAVNLGDYKWPTLPKEMPEGVTRREIEVVPSWTAIREAIAKIDALEARVTDLERAQKAHAVYK